MYTITRRWTGDTHVRHTGSSDWSAERDDSELASSDRKDLHSKYVDQQGTGSLTAI